jgi:hypothetical protein
MYVHINPYFAYIYGLTDQSLLGRVMGFGILDRLRRRDEGVMQKGIIHLVEQSLVLPCLVLHSRLFSLYLEYKKIAIKVR